jgi:hypothetical protein
MKHGGSVDWRLAHLEEAILLLQVAQRSRDIRDREGEAVLIVVGVGAQVDAVKLHAEAAAIGVVRH